MLTERNDGGVDEATIEELFGGAAPLSVSRSKRTDSAASPPIPWR